MNYLILIIFAFLPSIAWLLYFLRKDVHPESNRMVLKIFFYGILAAIPAVLIELGFSEWTSQFTSVKVAFLISILNIFIGVALVEELLKYLVVRVKVLKSQELDEPFDVMLYMIIAALGFVVFENLLIFLSPDTFSLEPGETFLLLSFRFISATFLHALASGTLGFFMALSFFETKKRGILFLSGISIVAILHGLYNFSIMKVEGNLQFTLPSIIKLEVNLKLALPIIIITGLAFFVSFGFRRLKKLAGICKAS